MLARFKPSRGARWHVQGMWSTFWESKSELCCQAFPNLLLFAFSLLSLQPPVEFPDIFATKKNMSPVGANNDSHTAAVNLARRWSVQNEHDLLQVRVVSHAHHRIVVGEVSFRNRDSHF